jgi:hypothetical protein
MQLQLKIKTLQHRIVMPVNPFASAPGPLEGCVNASSDVTMFASMQVEDILSMCYEM